MSDKLAIHAPAIEKKRRKRQTTTTPRTTPRSATIPDDPNFRQSKREAIRTSKTSLEVEYQRKINTFEKQLDKLPQYKRELKLLEQRRDKMEKSEDIQAIQIKIEKKYLDIQALKDTEQEKCDYLLDVIPYLMRHEEETQKMKEDVSSSNVGKIYNEYISRFQPSVSCNLSIETNDDALYCVKCDIDRVLDMKESTSVCPRCGDSVFLVDPALYRSHAPMEANIGCYKRANHCSEWLSQFIARESTRVPHIVYMSLIEELKKIRIENVSEITPTLIRCLLKKRGYSKYYEHTHHIINSLCGIPPPQLSSDLETKVKDIFQQIQEPYKRNRPSNRTNFFSYSYTFHKIFQLLSETQYLQFFKLPKSRDRLFVQEIVWKKICEEKGWEYIPSL